MDDPLRYSLVTSKGHAVNLSMLQVLLAYDAALADVSVAWATVYMGNELIDSFERGKNE